MKWQMNFLPSAVVTAFADLTSSQCKSRHHERIEVAIRSALSGTSLPAREQSFYALIEQFWFARSRRFHYPVGHASDCVLPSLELKPD
jgi:hypothetical protein